MHVKRHTVSTICAALAVICVLGAEGKGAAPADHPPWGKVIDLRVYTARSYLEGGPILVAIELWNKGETTCYLGGGRRPMPNWLGRGFSEPMSVFLITRDLKRQYIAKGCEPGPGGPHRSLPSFPLAKGERLRTLVDLTDFVMLNLDDVTPHYAPRYRALAPEPGFYGLTMCFHFIKSGLIRFPDPGAARSYPMAPLRMEASTELERDALRKVYGKTRSPVKPDTWYISVLAQKDESVFNDLPPRVEANLKPYLFLRKTRHVQNLGDVSFEDLDALDKTHLAPEASVWRYELLLAKGKKEEAATLRKKIEADHPGLLWRLKEIDDGHGYLKSFSLKDL